MSTIREAMLDDIRSIRENHASVTKRKLDFAEHVLRIPSQDFQVIKRFFPKLESKDAAEQSAEWERFFASDLAAVYRVARTPTEVQRSPRRSIIV